MPTAADAPIVRNAEGLARTRSHAQPTIGVIAPMSTAPTRKTPWSPCARARYQAASTGWSPYHLTMKVIDPR
jgi:hypothetical protein